MPKRARVLDDNDVVGLNEIIVRTSAEPARDFLIFALSFKAGLRVAEIAGLRWRDVLDRSGNIGQKIGQDLTFIIPSNIAKKGHERRLPMHPLIEARLRQYRDILSMQGVTIRPDMNIIRGAKGPTISANTLQKYIAEVYRRANLWGCSSHSGRRTFITTLARVVNKYDCHLKDVQLLAGHSDISTTEAYLEPSPGVGRLVNAL